MEQYQKDFVDFTLETGVLKFGEFTLKSGRVSPYFFNAGLFNTGSHLSELGKFYAHANNMLSSAIIPIKAGLALRSMGMNN